jgi:hypothetical protein
MRIKRRTLKRRATSLLHESRADDERDEGWRDFHNGEGRDPSGSDWYQDGYDEAEENSVRRGDAPRRDPGLEVLDDDEFPHLARTNTNEGTKIRVTKRQLRSIIKEEIDSAAEGDEGRDIAALKAWLKDTATKSSSELAIASTQVPALLNVLKAVMSVASAGKLKPKEEYLVGLLAKLSGAALEN